MVGRREAYPRPGGVTSAFHTHFTDNIVRVGLNYRFGGAVVAK
jgi:hypothetical protein